MLLVTAVKPGAGSRWSAAAELSPDDIAADLDKLAIEVLGNQLRALIALRQPGLRILSDPAGLGRAVLTAQARNAKAARHFLGAIQPRMALLVAEVTLLGDLMRDLNQTLARTACPDEADQALTRAIERMRDYENGARDGLAMARTNTDITDNTVRMLDKAIDKTIGELSGKDGRIMQAKAAIERTERTVSDAVRAVLGEPGTGGPGLRDLVTGSAPLFSGMTGARRRDCGTIAEFHVGTIAMIAPDRSEHGAAPQTIRDGNALLQSQYRVLAAFGAMLAAAQVIRGQTVELAEAAGRLARIAGETDATLATVIASTEALRTRLAKGETVATIAAELDSAMSAWARLTIRSREIGRILSGINLLFPET